MANAETQIRVSSEAATTIAELRDRYGYGSLAVVVDKLLLLYKDDFVGRHGALHTPGHDRPA